MDGKELFKAGKLAEATAAATEEVKRHPTDVSRRGFLCELLCFAGEYSRADAQLDAIGHQDPQLMLGLSMFRQLIRAEQARQQFYTDGRVPEFIAQPGPHLSRCLEASICIREGRPADAVKLLDEAESLRPIVTGVCNGQPFEGLRDVDDLTAPFFEVLTSNGKYYWIPIESVEVIEFRAPERTRDLLWRRVHMVVRGGPDGEVFLPTLYSGSAADPDEQIRIGHKTDWRGGEGTPVRGVGQRMYLIGDDGRSILELEQLSIVSPVSESAE
jgi:type VI secretion system protein ImpE